MYTVGPIDLSACYIYTMAKTKSPIHLNSLTVPCSFNSYATMVRHISSLNFKWQGLDNYSLDWWAFTIQYTVCEFTVMGSDITVWKYSQFCVCLCYKYSSFSFAAAAAAAAAAICMVTSDVQRSLRLFSWRHPHYVHIHTICSYIG